jgi:hypothetical protein
MNVPRSRSRLAALSLAVALVASLASLGASPAGAAAAGSAAPAPPEQTLGTIRRTGTINLSELNRPAAGGVPAGNEIVNVEIEKPATGGATPVVPNPSPTPVLSTSSASLVGTDGINHLDQRSASNGNQQSLEPPDQGLCVGNGHVIETVNVALQVYSAGSLTTEIPTTGLNAFFGLPPMIDRMADPITFGPFLSDPRCYFDAQTQRFYFTVLEIDRHRLTGNLGPGAATLLAVSQTNDPTQGWGLFRINALDNGRGGTPSHPDCPCFGDQPVIGADANGFYFSTNEYSLDPFGTFFNGAQLYAMSKRLLAQSAVDGRSLPLVHFAAGNLGLTFPPVEGIPASIASVQPASTPPGAAYADNTEYFLSSFDVNVNKSDNRIALWAMTNTSSLDSTPNLSLGAKILTTEPYAGGPPAGTPVRQKAGPRPLGQFLGEPLPTINADDDRMQAPTYVNGMLTSAITTGVGAGRVTKTGIAWFVVVPYMVSGQISGTVVRQGYVAAPDTTSLMYPFVGLNQYGLGAIALSLTGPDNFPSMGYIAFNPAGPTGSVHIARAGVGPEDGFTCYVGEGFAPPCRWGDYSYAVADESGHVWVAGEDIPGPRTSIANWGTFFGRLDASLIQAGP